MPFHFIQLKILVAAPRGGGGWGVEGGAKFQIIKQHRAVSCFFSTIWAPLLLGGFCRRKDWFPHIA